MNTLEFESLITEVEEVIVTSQVRKQAKSKAKGGDDKDGAKELQNDLTKAKNAAQREKDKDKK